MHPPGCMYVLMRFVNAISQETLFRITSDFLCRHSPAWSRNEVLIAVQRFKKNGNLKKKIFIVNTVSRTPLIQITRHFVCGHLLAWPRIFYDKNVYS